MAPKQDHVPTSKRSPSARNGSVGQFSFAPATKTTVVTTTTTTTTTFPPFVMPSPKCLKKRDPELYPMAARPTPKQLRKLRFNFGNQFAWFEEAEEQQQQQPSSSTNELTSPIQPTNEDSPNRRRSRQPSSRISKTGSSNAYLRPTSSSRQELEEMDGLRRQSATPISISEDSDYGNAEETDPRELAEHPKSLHIADAISEPHQPLNTATPNGDSEAVKIFKPIPSKPSPLATSRQARSYRAAAGANARSNNPLQISLNPAGSATPPVGESDTGYFDTFAAPFSRRTRSSLPNVIDTPVIQDASLPSPSLSPITAAAHLHQRSTSERSADNPFALEENVADPQDSEATPDPEIPFKNKESGILECDKADETCVSNHQFPPPSIHDIPDILDKFDTMPENLKCYVLYQLLRRSAKPTLHFVAEAIEPALKCDFLHRLPLELSQHVIRYLDFQSMCRAAQVSKKWRHIVNSDEKAWKDLLDTDGFILPDGEIKRAVEEGWGWQFPCGPNQWEKNLNPNTCEGRELRGSNSATSTSFSDSPKNQTPSGKRKRLTRASSSNKKPRRKSNRDLNQPSPSLPSLDDAQGPNAFASAALSTVPNPNLGISSLQSLHLFKSIYQRHHQIRRCWLDPDTKPKHIAFRAHERHVVTCLQFDSDKILTGSDDAIIDIYDTKTGAQLKRLSGHEGGVWALEYQGDILVSGSTDRSVRVWNMRTGKCLQVFQGHTSTVRCLQIVNPVKTGVSSDGSPIMMPKEPLIITGSRDSSCRVWKLPKLEGRSIFQAGPAAVDFDNPYFVRSLTGHTHSVRAIAAHGDTLVSGSYDGTVRVWAICTGDTVHRLSGHTAKVYSVVLDHQRSRCISGSMDNLVKVWSLETGENLFTLTGHHSLVGLLDLKDDFLVSAAADSTLKIWDPETGKIQHTLRAHTGAITCFAHDGQKVISGSDRTLKMWNTRSGACIKDLLTDLNGVWQVRFDERRCIAAVNRNDWTFIEVLDFGAARDGIQERDRGRRIVVDAQGEEVGEELTNSAEDEVLDEDDDDEQQQQQPQPSSGMLDILNSAVRTATDE